MQVCQGGFYDVSKDTFDAAASKINGAGINVVVNLDGWTSAPTINEIFILKPAQSSVNFKGYAGTLGDGIVHGLVADRVVTPPDMSAHYRERLLLLPNSFHYNGHSLLYPDAISKYKQRSDVPGLPQYEDAVVMCNWNQFYKFNPVMFSIYIHVMKELPDVYVWLMGWDNFTQSAFRYCLLPVASPYCSLCLYLSHRRHHHYHHHRHSNSGPTPIPTASAAVALSLQICTRRSRTSSTKAFVTFISTIFLTARTARLPMSCTRQLCASY